MAVHPSDWGLQACQVVQGGEVFVHKRGTFGIASAAYWWGRLAACIVRFTLLVAGGSEWPVWILLYADDLLIVAEGRRFLGSIVLVLWALELMRVPLKWRKCAGGFKFSWLGYEMSVKEWTLGISASRAAWLTSWFAQVLLDGRVLMRTLREVLGRCVFVYGALLWDRPFLAPLFAFLSLWEPSACVELPLYVRLVVEWLKDRLAERRSHPVAEARHLAGCLFRVDARAEGDIIMIGGWEPLWTGGPPPWGRGGSRSSWTALGLRSRVAWRRQVAPHER